MKNSSNEYCKIYLDASAPIDELAKKITDRFGVLEPWHAVRSDTMDLELRENESYIQAPQRNNESDFIHFRYYMDIDPLEGALRERYIGEISALLKWFWSQNFRAVAACGFEDELPRHKLGSF